jgi:opacity protein-like surface antigen
VKQLASGVVGVAFAAGFFVLSAPRAALAGPGADWLWGGGFHFGLPTGDFDKAADEGYGAAGHFVVTPQGRPLGLRGEVSALVYGSRSYELSGREGEVRLDTWFGNMLLGPELRARSGVVRPYVHALAGLGYFATTTEVPGEMSHAGDTSSDDTAFAWAVGGGVEIAVTSDVSVDLGARYLSNVSVDYLAESGMAGSGSSMMLQPRHGDANAVCFTLGLSFGR